MVNNLKIKKYWIATLCMVFCSLSSFAQDLSDATIGFDIARTTASLKEHGVKDQNMELEISMSRDMQKRQYLETKKVGDAITQKINSEKSSKTNASKSTLASPEVLAQEKAVLIALYNSTNGPGWTNTINNQAAWPVNDPNSIVTSWDRRAQTGWYGITVNANGNITGIELVSNKLTGTIPPQINQLTQLSTLNLLTNNITGPIIPEITQLPLLTRLSLSNNPLTGTIPSEVYQLKKLQILELASTQITGIISPQIGTLTDLSVVSLGNNQLTGNIPFQIGSLNKLVGFYVTGNKLEGNIPLEIGQLSSILILDLSGNQLTGTIPTQIGQLKSMAYLYLGANKLEGTFIPELLLLPNLEILRIGGNKFTGTIPTQINVLTKLQQLDIGGNGFTGTIPDEIGQLPKLISLNLGLNQLTGTIPLSIGQLTNLTASLLLGGNKLVGTIPPQIFKSPNLKWLDLGNNQFTGNVPFEISQLLYLNNLYLHANQLEGEIPNLSQLPLNAWAVSDNKFRFIDLATQSTNRLNNANYAPQAKTDLEENITKIVNGNVTLTMYTDGRFTTDDTYQWYKGIYPSGVQITGATAREYKITNLQTTNSGDYYCLSRNPKMTVANNSIRNLILVRNQIHLTVSNCSPTEGSITSTTDKFHTNAESSFAFESTATGLTYQWSVTPANGTTTSNTLNSYTHTFTDAGDYEVKLVATDANGCSTTFTKAVKVEDRYCDNEPIDFAFNTTETNLTYNWTSTDALGNIVHRETNSTGLYTFTPLVGGEYVIELVASSATSCKTLFSKNVIVDQCSAYISCTKDNPLSPEIHRLFINLIGKLASTPTGTNVNVYAHKEIAAVAPYTGDKKATIYNFTNTDEAVSFSFSATAAENEIYIPKSTSGSVTAINLDKYKDALTSTIVATSYTSGATNNSDGHVRNIDFCPKELSCVSHIALVVDESGSLDLTEINKIKKQLKLFVAKQAFTNDDIGSNIHVSITGMSDSDANTRTDFIAPTKMTAGNVGMFNAWIDKLGKRYGDTGISQASDYWKSGLDGALAYTMKPTFVLMITDGSQTANVQGLKETFTKFDNNNKTVTVPKLPHLYVVGIENGNYVDRDSYTSKLSRDLDPNYNPSLGSNNSLTAKTTPLLTKSLQYLLGLSATEFPVSDINQFNVGTYFGHSNFDLLASDETYFADKVVTGEFACGTPAIKDFCDDCFSFKPEPGKEYILSAWVKEESVEQVKTYTNPVIQLVFYNNKEALDIKAQKIDSLSIKASGDIIDGWQRVVQKFKIPSNTITIGIELENLSPSIPVYFDDIRIHPLQGSVKSFVYDPETFKLMSELDENNYSTFYEYDNEGGLVRVKKETAKGVKTIQETRSGNVINATTTNP